MYYQLSQEERYRISAERQAGNSLRQIAEMMGRSPSTISRELKRNFTQHDGYYRAENAYEYCGLDVDDVVACPATAALCWQRLSA